MERPLASPRGVLRRHAAPAMVLATGLLTAGGVSLYVAQVVERQQEARFREHVSGIEDALRMRMGAYVAKLRSARGLLDVLGRDPTREELGRFVESFELRRYYPGIQGIGWSKALRPEEVAAHEEAVRARGRPDYRVWPPGERPLYTSIVDLEPLDWRNERAIGFDMFSDPTRRAAMERARDTGEVASSGGVELVQEAGEERQAGFLVYLAVYEQPPSSVEERRALLRGWVYAPFRAADLLHGTVGRDPARGTALAVYDGPESTPAALLYDSGVRGSATFTAVRSIDVAGRPWTLRYEATRSYASRWERALPGAVLAAGLVIALLLFAMVRDDTNARARAERAAARASLLADAGKVLSASTDYDRTLPDVAVLAAERAVQGCLVHLPGDGGPPWIAGHRDATLALRAAKTLRDAAPDLADPLGVTAALRRADAQVREIDRRRAAASSPLLDVAREMGATTSVAVPLAARGQVLGVIVLLARRLEEADLRLGEDLARLVSAAIDTGRLYRRAQEAVAARDEFLSIASHELKTPLTSLVLHSDGLRAAARRHDADAAAKKAEVIRRNVDRLSRLVASMLDISRIGAGRLDLELEEVDLAEIARDVAARFEDEAHRAGCAIHLHADTPVVGRWDATRIDQVVTNLLANALKYGTGRPVDVTVEADGGTAILSVGDHGIGISEADQTRIFQRFERAVSRRNYGGFGLGLWIVRQIVEALGGSVRVESVPGEGSTFIVELAREVREPARGADGEERSGAPGP